MPKCTTKRVAVTKICAGDLRHEIEVQTRSMDSPNTGGVDFDVSLNETMKVRAMIETTPNEAIFDGSNIEQTVTHKFYIRFISGVTFQNWVRFKGRFYSIVGNENLQEEDQYVLLRCNVRGDVNKPVNLA